MLTAVYPGSFDPVTVGHVNIIERASAVFDEIIVAVLHNPDKRPLFSAEQRVTLLRDSLQHLPGVRVDQFTGLLVDYMRTQRATIIVRGVRTAQDLSAEWAMSCMNRDMAKVDTVLFPTEPGFAYISSSLIKDIARHGGAVDPYVPAAVARAMQSLHREG